MASTAQTYYDAAQENLLRAQENFDREEYFLAHYLFGLAVECHLRAYLRKKTNIFDSGHDLRELAEESDFYTIVPKDQLTEFSRKFAILNLRWRSNHRYYSERQFLDYMTEIKAGFNLPGNRWKNFTRTVQNLAYEIVNQGEAKWDSK